MGRASGRSRQQASGNVVALGTRSARNSGSRLDPERDALWFKHAKALRTAASLLQRVNTLDDVETEKLCSAMTDIGRSAGLDGPWCVLEGDGGRAALAYCSSWEERMPAAKNIVNWHVLPDRFDGGLIDGLSEPRFLGRQTLELAQNLADSATATS